MTKKNFIIILALVCLLFASCSKNTQTITDDFNRKVEVKKDIKKIVCLSPGIGEMIYKFSMQKYLVGRSDFCVLPQEISNVESLGGLYNVDVNRIKEIKPDIVLCSSILPKSTIDTLQNNGIAVVVFKDNKTVESMYKSITLLGKIFNKESLSESMINDIKKQITLLDKSKQTNKPKVYYVIGFGNKMDLTANSNTLIGNILYLSGCDNIAKDDKDMIFSQEELEKIQPDYIFVRQEDYDRFIITSPYSQLNAVKNNKVFPINSNLLGSLSPSNVSAIKYISSIINKK